MGSGSTAEARDSLLQAAPLVGRAAELERLEEAVRATIAGSGSAWLVGGESGSGKSRLLDHVRAFGLVGGARVLRGGEVSEGGTPYRSWREPLRMLARSSALSPLEASVLLPVIPKIGALIEARVEPAPELEAPSMHARVVEVVLGMVRRQRAPAIVLLEDLQWSHTDTLELLRALLPLTAELPLMLLATYRNDERPDLPFELPEMHALQLTRLSNEAIAELALGIIGPSAGLPQLQRLLETESEGNPFYLMEVLRALADDAGGFDEIATKPLPARIYAGGVRRIVHRRLSRAPAEALPLLRAAAIAGRSLDAALLAELFPGVDREPLLSSCVDAGVLERHAGGLRFPHDKLREGLLAELDETERAKLHGEVGRAIERVHPDAIDRVAALAYHFRAARLGDQETASAAAARYAALAGEQAIRHAPDREAVELLERALALTSPRAAPLELVRLHSAIGKAYFFLMELPRAIEHLTAAVEIAGRSLQGGLLEACRQLAIQIAHRCWPRGFVSNEESRRAELLEASRAAARLSIIHTYRNDTLGQLTASLASVNLAENAGRASVASLGVLGLAAGCARLDRVARGCFRRMHDAPVSTDELGSLTQGIISHAAHLIGAAELDAADQVLAKNVALSHSIGDPLDMSYTEYLLGVSAFHRGELVEAAHRGKIARERLQRTSLARHVGRFSTLEALALSALGNDEEALEVLSSTERSFTALDRLPQAIWFGVTALISARKGNASEAEAAADASMRLGGRACAAGASGAGLFAGATETALLALSAALAGGGDLRRARKRFEKAMRMSRLWSFVSPIGRAQTILYHGRGELLLGKPERARRSFERCLAESSARGLGLFEALAHVELGRLGEPGAGERSQHLALARQRFSSQGALAQVAAIDALDRALAIREM